MSSRLRTISTAVTGGCGGALAMDVVQSIWARAFESGRPADIQDEETEAIASVVAYLTRAAPDVFRVADAQRIGRVLHYLFGIAFAGGYLALVPSRRPSTTRAMGFGTLLWLLSDRILIPALKLGRPWSRYSRAERSNALASHLAYAFVVEFARPRA